MNRQFLLAAILLLSAPVFGHHSTAMFDANKTITVTGTVKEFQYSNPHSWLIVEVRSDDGSVVTWGFEAEGPTTLMRSGIRKSTLPAGTRLTITGHPMTDGRPAAAWVKAVLEDGSELNPRNGFVPR
ncbi:MAG: DUF6152 family protein [Pseudohongiellaceae bacterium]|jgi:hypothetical protein